MIRVLIIILGIFQISSGQENLFNEVSIAKKDTVYVDEDNNIIDPLFFNNKLNSIYYYANVYESDEKFYLKLQWTHYYGQLNHQQRRQLFKNLNSEHQVDTTKIIVIHYLDTLKNPKSYPKKNKIVKLDERSHIHLINYKTFLKQNKSCLKSFKKNKLANVYHFYDFNDNHPNIIDNLIWYSDYQKRIKLFFGKNVLSPRTIIINTDGKYFIHYYYTGIYNLEVPLILSQNQKWEEFSRDFYYRTKILNKYKSNTNIN
jgi:hypothetical protein